MTRCSIRVGALVLAALACLGSATAAQEPQTPPPAQPVEAGVPAQPEQPAPSPQPPARRPRAARPAEPVEQVEPVAPDEPQEQAREYEYDRRWWGRGAVRVGGNFRLPAGDELTYVQVALGDAVIEGRVYRDVVVGLGMTHLAGTAVVEGSVVVIGGSARIEPGARVNGDLVVLGGELEAPAGFTPGGEQHVWGPTIIGGRLEGLVPWITQGLLWGRPIVPTLGWVWSIVGLFFLAYLALNVVFDRPVRACAATLAQKPLSAFLTGLLVLLAAGPVLLLLTATLVGIAVVPFAVGALVLAWLLGKVGVARWLGMGVLPEDDGTVSAAGQRARGVRSFAIGFALITIAYMIPVLGLIAWATVGAMGLGAATMAFMAGYRRENPSVPRVRRAAAAAVPSSGAIYSSAPIVPPPAASDPFVPPAPPPMSFEEASVSDSVPPLDTPPAYAQPFVPAPPAPMTDLAAFPHAAFLDRLAAFVLDVILVAITVAMLDLARYPGDQRFFFLLLAYHIGFWTWKGTTVGGIICQLRVVRVDGEPVRFIDAVVRGLSSILSLAVLGLGGLWILKDPERQAWHDKVAGTYVVKVPRHYPL